MKRSEIYREAARKVVKHDMACTNRGLDCYLSCCALSELCRDDDENAEYYSVQKPYAAMFVHDADWWGKNEPGHEHDRATALLMMAAIAESEE